MMENEHQASPSSLQLVWKARFPWHPSLNGRRSFCRSKQAASNMLVALHPGAPPAPVAILGVHSSSNGFDFSRNPEFGYVGQAFIAQFGDQSSTSGKVLAPVGFKVVRVDPATGVVQEFAANKGNQMDRLQKSEVEVWSGRWRPDSIHAAPHSTSSISES